MKAAVSPRRSRRTRRVDRETGRILIRTLNNRLCGLNVTVTSIFFSVVNTFCIQQDTRFMFQSVTKIETNHYRMLKITPDFHSFIIWTNKKIIQETKRSKVISECIAVSTLILVPLEISVAIKPCFAKKNSRIMMLAASPQGSARVALAILTKINYNIGQFAKIRSNNGKPRAKRQWTTTIALVKQQWLLKRRWEQRELWTALLNYKIRGDQWSLHLVNRVISGQGSLEFERRVRVHTPRDSSKVREGVWHYTIILRQKKSKKKRKGTKMTREREKMHAQFSR